MNELTKTIFMPLLITLRRNIACAILLWAVPVACFADIMMLWQDDWLQQARSELEAGQPAKRPALDAIIEKADLALSRGPYSVTDKTGFPENRDIHDYYSQGPYWWPDP